MGALHTAAPTAAAAPVSAVAPARAAVTRGRLRVGHLWVDALTQDGALAAVEALVARGAGGSVFTPNVDHVVLAERDAAFRAAYDGASLVLADGAPIVGVSRLLGLPLPEKLSGSDMLVPIAQFAARRGWRVYLLGGGPGVAAEAGRRLRDGYGVNVVGVDDAFVSRDPDAAGDAAVAARVRAARPDFVFVALGTPKQELFIARTLPELAPAVVMGVGATFDFFTGRVRRAPAWVSRAGFEWLFRLGQEPRRLWRRYLVQDPKFVLVVLRALRRPRAERVRHAPAP